VLLLRPHVTGEPVGDVPIGGVHEAGSYQWVIT
jgi:hypothetical protein